MDNQAVIDSYISENKLFHSAQALRNGIRQQIFTFLSNRNSMSFNELLGSLNLSRSKLAYHLQIMVDYNIVNNFYDKRPGVKDHSFYELSAFGRELFAGGTSKLQPVSQLNEDIDAKQSIAPSITNFRTMRHIEYKSYDKLPYKRTQQQLRPITKDENKYFDPIINCKIINKTATSKETKKVTFPSFRITYLSYRHPFKSKKSVHPTY